MSKRLTQSLILTSCLALASAVQAKPHDDQWRYGSPSHKQTYNGHSSYKQGPQHATQYARVVAATPIYRQVEVSEPRQECWSEQVPVHHNQKGSITNEVVGGIIGGAIGNALGHNSSNKKVGAVVGAVLGASIAHDIQPDRSRPVSYKEERRCRQVSHTRYEQQLQGYDVTYRYQGRQYQTQMPHHPGDQLAVQVSVTPVSRYR